MLNSAFFEAASILLREGLEAILVLAALAAYLGRSGAQDKLGALYGGASLAVLASVAAAWVFEQFYGGAHNDLIEAGVMLFAAVLMFYVSGWLFLKQDPRAWQAYLKSHTDKVMAKGTLVAVALLAFLAVFREGAETVLFLHAVAKSGGGWTPAVWAGIGVEGLALTAVFAVVTHTTRRLPLRWVFTATSAFLFLMGLKFVGLGLQEMQEQALLPYHPVPGADALTWLGLNPTWEAVSAQLAILVVALASMAWLLRERAVAAPEVTRTQIAPGE